MTKPNGQNKTAIFHSLGKLMLHLRNLSYLPQSPPPQYVSCWRQIPVPPSPPCYVLSWDSCSLPRHCGMPNIEERDKNNNVKTHFTQFTQFKTYQLSAATGFSFHKSWFWCKWLLLYKSIPALVHTNTIQVLYSGMEGVFTIANNKNSICDPSHRNGHVGGMTPNWVIDTSLKSIYTKL